MASTSTARSLILSFKPLHPPPPPPSSLFSHRHPLSLPPTTASAFLKPLRTSSSVVCCFVPGVEGNGGGGVSDARKSEFSREFAVISTMLKRIEPLDTSDVSQGVSDSAKDSMKQTISTMLGILPSDQFDVSVRVSKLPLHRLLSSSIITGYTLWNAEYRMLLMKNFELPFDRTEAPSHSKGTAVDCGDNEVQNSKLHAEDGREGLEQSNADFLKALNYVQQLEAELSVVNNELDAQRQQHRRMESNRPNDNNLLEYLRSLQSEMVSELSRPSSLEVKEVIDQLVQNMLQKFFKEDSTSEDIEDRATGKMENHLHGVSEDHITISTSRDYLAKLLFWCMLLGHHLRGLENRLHLSFVIGML